MRRHTAIRIISFSLAAVLVSIGFVIKTQSENRRYRLELESSYSRNLDDFGSAINNISDTLNKAKYATTAESLSRMAAQLLAEAQLSKTALSQLPAGEELTVLNRFLSQVGNYAMSVSGSLISGKEIDEQFAGNIELLSDTANTIAQLVRDSRITYNNSEYWAMQLDQKIMESVDSDSLANALGELEGQLSDFPTLVYDGPYSDHILEKEPEMLKGAEDISREKAVEIAAKYCECSAAELKDDGIIEGNIPSYRFSSEGVSVAVSRQGGYVYFMRKVRNVENSLLSYEQAMEKAKRYLERIGMSNLKQTYYYDSEGVCVINFAYQDGQTICYTDLIKIGVAMDNGEIMLYEAGGYISNHKERAFLASVYTPEDAKALISSKLGIQGVSLALIPTRNGGEERCYEFKTLAEDEQEILVYINAVTLAEEEILILLKSDGGILVK